MTVRVDPELHERAKTAVAQSDSNLNAHVVAFLRWLVHDTEELPTRPEVQTS
ncbi:toxin-antitoxin system HicB family antitoxin [Nocardia sp. R16R-3T]